MVEHNTVLYTVCARPLSVQAVDSRSWPLLSSSCYNGCLITWTVVCFTAATFKPHIFPVSLDIFSCLLLAHSFLRDSHWELMRHLAAQYCFFLIQARIYGKRVVLRATCLMQFHCLAYSSTLKMEAIYSSEYSVVFQWIKQCYIPEDTSLQIPSFCYKISLRSSALKWRILMDLWVRSDKSMRAYFIISMQWPQTWMKPPLTASRQRPPGSSWHIPCSCNSSKVQLMR
jgi:hypothetical protein